MAAKDLDSSDLKKHEELDDMTTCCICTEVYTDPKALPCIRTFCMKCLQETGLKSSKGPEDEMPCPICRRLFKIPAEGFPGLPKHFFIERLIQLSKVSDSSPVMKVLCSVCLEESKEQEGKETPTADVYCVECKHQLCEECCSEHRKFKATKNHKLMQINEDETFQNVATNLASMVCEVHEKKILDVYCADCKGVVCAICFIEEHNGHKGSHVNKCVDGFRKQIETNTEKMNECIGQIQMKKAEIVRVKEEMNQKVELLESDIDRRKVEIKEFADKHASYLLQYLCCERESRLKEIQMAADDINACISNLDSYNSYCQRILDKGSAIDICSALSDLSIRAVELQQACQPLVEREIPGFRFFFSQSELEELSDIEGGNVLGDIQEEGNLQPKKRSKQILIAELSNEIDLLRKEIENERSEKQSLKSTIEEQRIYTDRETQTLKEKLIKENANYQAHLEKQKQEFDNNKIINRTEFQANNDKLKKELDAEKTKNNSLQVNNDKLLEELERCKAALKTANAEKLRKEVDSWKSAEQRYPYISDPVLVQTIRTKATQDKNKEIYGLTILDKELFVVHCQSSEVEVYDLIKLSLSRRWNLKGLISPLDIVSCIRNSCVYINDFKGLCQLKEILRVDPNGNVIKNWPTGVSFGRLSVSYESTLILASHSQQKLNEYSPNGQLIREIDLSSTAGIRSPLHAIKLTNAHFIVSHGDCADLHRVCLVDADGKLKKSFGGRCGSTIGQLNGPVHLSVDGNGFVMVVDQENSRILLLDSDLRFKKEILSKEKHGLRNPWRILLDESNGRLFVADNKSDHQRILTFELK